MDIDQLLEKLLGDDKLLNEESKTVIKEEFEKAVGELVEEKTTLALEAQDLDHAKKLETLVEAIDTDHTSKLKEVVESIDEDHTSKLKEVQAFYESKTVTEAKEFKDNLIDKVDMFIEKSIDKAIPNELLESIAQAKHYQKLVEQMKTVLSVGAIQDDEEIKEAIVDGKQQITSLEEKVKALEEENEKFKVEKLIESKTKGFTKAKTEYIKSLLKGKTSDHAERNFEYIVEMFEQKEIDEVSSARKEANQKSLTKDVDSKVLEEGSSKEEGYQRDKDIDSNVAAYVQQMREMF